ncbi:MAG TPA: hypothetical protein VFY83_15745 [Anaerolineales bacterium]|jgi:hypothetical protein|nr:hypothetical protein [Anaerolineales bacterium]
MNKSTNPRQRSFVVGLIVIGLMIIAFFGLRTVRAFRQFQDHRPPPPFATQPAETNVNRIRDWMTIPFISRMYHVRQHILFEGLGIPEQGNQDKSLRQLNAEYFPEAPGMVETKIKATLLENMPPGIATSLPALP